MTDLADILERHAARAQQAAKRSHARISSDPSFDVFVWVGDDNAAETALAHCAIHYAAGLRSEQPANILPPLPALTSRTKASLITTATQHRNNMLAAGNDDMPLHVWARHWQISSHYMENLAR